MNKITDIIIEIPILDEIESFEFKFNDKDKLYHCKVVMKFEVRLDEYKRCDYAKRRDNSELFNEQTEILEDFFRERYNLIIDSLNEDTENGVEFTENEILRNDVINIPYDPNSIRVTQARFSLKEVYEMIVGDEYDEAILDLSPDFQRGYVWDNTRKSRLIESILLKIPLPVFYLSRDDDGRYQVVDGAQRLSVIKEYFSNGFKLINLEYLKNECEYKYFSLKDKSSLNSKFIRALRTYQIDCNIIEPDTPHKVKLDIFKRLNTGGKRLNNQEIRNSISKKQPRDFIRKLANSEEFLLATNKSISSKRMMDQEMILRYIGFYFIYKRKKEFPELEYNGKMNAFLDTIIEILNENYKYIVFDEIEDCFYKAMKNATTMFGQYSFRKVDSKYWDKDKNKINKSLFTIFSILLSDYDTNLIEKNGNKTIQFSEFLTKDKYLFDSITYLSAEKTSIDTTYLRINEFLNTIYGGLDD